MLGALGAEDLREWAMDVMRSVGSLLQADRTVLLVEEDQRPTFFLSDSSLLEAIDAYASHYAALDVYLNQRRQKRGLKAYIHPQLITPEEQRTSVFFNEWNRTYGMLDPSGIVIEADLAKAPWVLAAYHDRPSEEGFGERGLTLLRLITPSFESVVRVLRNVQQHRAVFPQWIDAAPTPILLVGSRGHVMHRNRAFSRQIDPADDVEVRTLAGQIALEVLTRSGRCPRRKGAPTSAPARARFRTRLKTWELSAVPATAMLGTAHDVVLVLLTPIGRSTPSPAWIRDAHGLTARQAEVATLLAMRLSTEEIAERLGISMHTARHHVEMVLVRLGAHSRHDVHGILSSNH
jgi:DNA-binding CsgD family transcriptional regulator